jgi:hypothetical protein
MLLSALVWTENAATLVWTNTAGGNWSNPAGWDPAGVPSPTGIAKITTSGNYTVTDDQDTTVAAIIVGSEVSGVQQVLVPAGVTLTATNPITMSYNGTFTVASGGIVDLANTAPLHPLIDWPGFCCRGKAALPRNAPGSPRAGGRIFRWVAACKKAAPVLGAAFGLERLRSVQFNHGLGPAHCGT